MTQPRRFAYFRDRSRRNESSPTSPVFDNNSSSFAIPSPTLHPVSTWSSQASPSTQSPVSPLPPTLPPIPRVASRSETGEKKAHGAVMGEDPRMSATSAPSAAPTRTTIRTVQPSFSSNTHGGAFILPPIPRVSSTRDKQSEEISNKADVPKFEGPRVAKRSTHVRKPTPQEPADTQHGAQRSAHEVESSNTLSAQSSNDYPVFKRPITPSNKQNEAYLGPTIRQEEFTSPSSSYSSFHRAGSATNLVTESIGSTPNRSPNAPVKEARQAKSKRNLLNPMSLLRRRSAQPPEEAVAATLAANRSNLDIPVMSLPEDYDPRIRGKGVHDFSAPRDKRSKSSNESTRPDVNTSDESRRPSTPSETLDVDQEVATTALRRPADRDRPPVFVEDFETTTSEAGNESAVRREDLANPDFLARMSRQLDFHDSSDTLPSRIAAAEKSTSHVDTGNETPKQDERISFGASSDASTMRSSISHETRATSPSRSPHKTHTRASLEPAFQPGRLSSQFSRSTSHASRFSFQLNNDRSAAQEKALEEKHKEKTRIQAAKAQRDSRFDDLEDDYLDEYDDMMDDDGLEERIPGVNAEDDEEDEEDNFPGLSNMDLSSASRNTLPQLQTHSVTPPLGASGNDAAHALVSGLGLVQVQEQQPGSYPGLPKTLQRQPTEFSKISDDMYFDDGMIESPGTQRSNTIDESALSSPNNYEEDQADALKNILTKSSSVYTGDTVSTHGTATQNGTQRLPDAKHEKDNGGQELQDYHQALANAANRAAEAGKFQRKVSNSEFGEDQAQLENEDVDATPRKPLRSVQLPQQTSLDSFEIEEDKEFEDIADDLDDDPMVAAANAEALAADDSGFYGREFGFYVSSHVKTDESYYGGYFGNNTVGLQNALREPNLTPITERSEFSTRNSFISVGGYGPPGSATYLSSSVPRDSMASVDLKTLAAQMSDQEEDNMTLSQLMRLRKETFGGSRPTSFGASSTSGQHSPARSASSLSAIRGVNAWAQTAGQEAPFNQEDMYQPGAMESPSVDELSHINPYQGLSYTVAQPLSSMEPPPFPHTPQDVVLGSNAPPLSHAGVINNATSTSLLAGLPTAAPISPPPQLNPAPMPAPTSSLMQKFNARPPANAYSNFHNYAHHRRSSSGEQRRESFPSADSVTYVRDDSEGDEPRWYLERRRTMDTGEVVIVGRQLVEGGRI